MPRRSRATIRATLTVTSVQTQQKLKEDHRPCSRTKAKHTPHPRRKSIRRLRMSGVARRSRPDLRDHLSYSIVQQPNLRAVCVLQLLLKGGPHVTHTRCYCMFPGPARGTGHSSPCVDRQSSRPRLLRCCYCRCSSYTLTSRNQPCLAFDPTKRSSASLHQLRQAPSLA